MKDSLTVKGQVHLYHVQPGGVSCFIYRNQNKAQNLLLPGAWTDLGLVQTNLVMYSAATIVGELLRGAPDGKPYKLGAAYIEFENNGGATVVPPANTNRGETLAYYAGLATSPTRDYLRVPISAMILDSTDEVNYPNGNRVVCFIETAGIVGVHGKEFSAAQQSRIYGGALVATPKYADPTQDILYSRVYFAEDSKQLIKPTNSQIAFRWPIVLE